MRWRAAAWRVHSSVLGCLQCTTARLNARPLAQSYNVWSDPWTSLCPWVTARTTTLRFQQAAEIEHQQHQEVVNVWRKVHGRFSRAELGDLMQETHPSCNVIVGRTPSSVVLTPLLFYTHLDKHSKSLLYTANSLTDRVLNQQKCLFRSCACHIGVSVTCRLYMYTVVSRTLLIFLAKRQLLHK